MSKISGGCLCGAVRYSADVEPVMSGVCHCRNCQRQSGSAFSILVGVPKGSLRFEGDDMAVYADQGESGLPVLRKFCGTCGSPILSEVGSSPDLDWIKAGTLDDVSQFKPAVHLWCDSLQPWVELPANAVKLPRTPPG